MNDASTIASWSGRCCVGQRREASVPASNPVRRNGAYLSTMSTHDTLCRESVEGALQFVVNPVVLKSAHEDVVEWPFRRRRPTAPYSRPASRVANRIWQLPMPPCMSQGTLSLGERAFSHVPPPFTTGTNTSLGPHAKGQSPWKSMSESTSARMQIRSLLAAAATEAIYGFGPRFFHFRRFYRRGDSTSQGFGDSPNDLASYDVPRRKSVDSLS